MKRTDLPPSFQKVLLDIPYVTIATSCPDGQPWNTPVVGFFDDELNLYWASWMQNQHSLNITHEPRVFVVIYDSSAPLGTGEGLYLQMKAQPCVGQPEIVQGKTVYTDRFGEDDCNTPFEGTCPRRVYKAVPERIWRNTDGARGEHFVDIREVLFEC